MEVSNEQQFPVHRRHPNRRRTHSGGRQQDATAEYSVLRRSPHNELHPRSVRQQAAASRHHSEGHQRFLTPWIRLESTPPPTLHDPCLVRRVLHLKSLRTLQKYLNAVGSNFYSLSPLEIKIRSEASPAKKTYSPRKIVVHVTHNFLLEI